MSQPYDDNRDRHAEVRAVLGVRGWASPLDVRRRPVVAEGPAWWYGDEEASQSFLREMGISP